jgi:glucose/arabinose dehydrogenase
MTQGTNCNAGWLRLLAVCAAVSGCGGNDSPAPAPNVAPSATINAAATGTVGAAMTLTATATDSDGSVTMVEFLDGTTVLGQDPSAPYSFSWTPTSTGLHSLTARATDNAGAITTSSAVTVTVSPASGTDTQPPIVTVAAPTAFASDLTGSVTFSANATDNVGVASVEFQIDGTALATDTTSPYSATVDSSQFASGQHILRVRARDAAGNQSVWSSVTVQFGGSQTQPGGFTRNESFITGLTDATAFAQAPDGRLFIAKQSGAMRVVKNGALLPTPFMTLSVDSSVERGLLGVAFHPNFASNNFVYAYYTTTIGGTHNRISRFTANGDVVQPGSEQVLVDLPTLGAGNHNGGAIHFALDGKLYVGVGENAVSTNSQDLTTPLGKLLRFNDDGTPPSDNPFFATQSGLARAVWAYGLRNPFTFAVQPGTGRIHINDVGEGTWEEIDVAAKGANFGWPNSEGPSGVTGNITGPVFTYKHSAASPAGSGPGGFFVGNVIAGGTFYPTAGGTFPAQYRGNYFFADSGATFIGMLDLANDNAAYSFGKVSGNPVDMLVASDGALLVLTRSNIVRFTPP